MLGDVSFGEETPMAKYENLKDYLRLNNMSVISQGLNDYIKSNSNVDASYKVNDIIIHTLAWNRFDFGLLTVTIGLSAKFKTTIDSASSLHYYNMTVQGQISKGLSDLSLSNIEEVSELLLQEETILSLFGMENITSDNIEKKAEELYSKLCFDIHINKEHKYWLPVIDIKEKYGMKLWPADLPDNCFGRLYLLPSAATIYDPANIYKSYPDEPIPRGAILLNRRYYINELDPDDIITTAHELSHWSCHQLYFLIMMLLEDGFDTMSCTTDPIILDDKMTSKEKAYFYAEWQANELSIRVAMPKHLVEEAIVDYEKDHSNILHDGHYYQNMIYKLSFDFNVPEEIMKKRFRQLGYDYADGTFLTVDDCLYQPFSFTPGILKENETFVINHANYERLLRDNKDFSELINTGKYVYLGYVVCLIDRKYIGIVSSSDDVELVLTDYAREHAEKCCIKFKSSISIQPYTNLSIYNANYMNKLPEFNEIVLESHELCEDNSELDEGTLKEIEEYNDILEKLNSEQCKTFANTLVFHMRRLNRDAKKIYDKINLSETIIHNYCKGKKEPEDERNIMALCIGLNLESDYCLDLFKKAGYSLEKDTMQNRCYKFLFGYTYNELDFCNKILRKFNQNELPYRRGNGKKRESKKLEVCI